MYKARCITMVIRAKRENPNEKAKKILCGPDHIEEQKWEVKKNYTNFCISIKQQIVFAFPPCISRYSNNNKDNEM